VLIIVDGISGPQLNSGSAGYAPATPLRQVRRRDVTRRAERRPPFSVFERRPFFFDQ
jgi:hypothetical protein